MFDYLDRPKSLLMALGNYVSHYVVTVYDPKLGHRLRTVEELNELDRFELAKDFFYKRFEQYDDYNNSAELKKILSLKHQMINEIAVYIDSRIPKSYYKWSNRRHDISPSQIKHVNAEEMGLIYYFKENDYGLCVTDKQRNHILDLVEDTGYIVKTFEDMTISEANMIIGFLLGDTYMPKCFSRYIVYED